jgi:hypothetical protein
MISSLVPKLVLCGLLVLTLSLKVSVGVPLFVSGQDEMVETYIATFLLGMDSNQNASSRSKTRSARQAVLAAVSWSSPK